MRLNDGKTFLIGFGFFGISLMWSVYNVYAPIFLRDRFELPPSIIGVVMTLDNIAALLIQPVIGVWSDRTRVGSAPALCACRRAGGSAGAVCASSTPN